MQAVLAPENMQRAWKQVKPNKGASGIDRISLQDFPAHARVHWPGIRQALIDGSYSPQPVRQVMIAKPGGGDLRSTRCITRNTSLWLSVIAANAHSRIDAAHTVTNQA